MADDLLECDREALAQVRATAHLPHSGRERDDPGRDDVSNMLVNERREQLSRLYALLGPHRLRALLRGSLTPFVRADLARIERPARPRDFLRSSTSATILRRAATHRERRARALATAPVLDVSDDNLLPLSTGRTEFLWDALLQFRALRRSNEMIDRIDGARDTNAQGRMTTSGILSALECARLAETAPGGRAGALWRLVLVNAPHQAPGTIFRASHLTLELLGPNDRGPFGKEFLPVYHAVHTLYRADTPKIVEAFARKVLGDDLAKARLNPPAHVRRGDALKLLELVECVTTLAPSPESLLRDRGYALAGRVDVENHVDALRRGDVVAALVCANRARMRLRTSKAASGDLQLRAWRLDRALEHQCALLLADVDHPDPDVLHHAKRAVQLTDALIAVGARDAREAALLNALDRLRSITDERARAIHFAGVRVLLDPRFVDRLAKETPIHAYLALLQRGAPTAGVRVLSPPAKKKFIPKVMVRAPKVLPDVDALIVREAPPGYSHLVVLARDRGVGLLVTDDLRSVRKLRAPLELVDGKLFAARGKPTAPRRRAKLRAPDIAHDDDSIYTLTEFAKLPLEERRRRAGEKAVVCAELLRAMPERALDGVVLTYGFSRRARGDLPRLRYPLIVRSAHSCEDLPGHSAAGLFLSRGGVRNERELARAVADVIASAKTVKRASPSVLIQQHLRAEISGVAFSRGADGAYGAIGYQAVRGGGGGVRGGDVEEGVVSPIEHTVTRATHKRLLDERRGRALGATVMQIEKLFFDAIEPGAGYAVDVEWLFHNGKLIIVQARAISP